VRIVALVSIVFALAAVPAATPSDHARPPAKDVKNVLVLLHHALASEQDAVTETKYIDYVTEIDRSLSSLELASNSLRRYDSGGAADEIRQAEVWDQKANGKLNANSRRWVRNAISHKKKAIAILESFSNRCETTKEFELFAIPAGYAGSTADVFPHGIPKGAKNIEVRFVDTATGHPAPEEPFPGQTWTSSVKGFEKRGGETVLHVHIDVAGDGYGKPDQHHVKWRVVVSWDC
jgi:hypothetical protein